MIYYHIKNKKITVHKNLTYYIANGDIYSGNISTQEQTSFFLIIFRIGNLLLLFDLYLYHYLCLIR